MSLVGRAKGAVHYAARDSKGGYSPMLAATRSSAVLAGVVGGHIHYGPVGAIAGVHYHYKKFRLFKIT